MLLLVHGHLPGLATSDGWVGCESEPGHTHLRRGSSVHVPRVRPVWIAVRGAETGWLGCSVSGHTGLYGTTWES